MLKQEGRVTINMSFALHPDQSLMTVIVALKKLQYCMKALESKIVGIATRVTSHRKIVMSPGTHGKGGDTINIHTMLSQLQMRKQEVCLMKEVVQIDLSM